MAMTDGIDQGMQAGITFLRETRASHLLEARTAKKQPGPDQADLVLDRVNQALQAHRAIRAMRLALRSKWEAEMGDFATATGTRIFLDNGPPVIVALPEEAVRDRLLKSVSRFISFPVIMDWSQAIAFVGESGETPCARDERISAEEKRPSTVMVNKDHIVLLQTVYWSIKAGEKAAA